MPKQKGVIHHKYPRSRELNINGFQFRIEDKENKIKIPEDYHKQLHALHKNTTPYQQFGNWVALHKSILDEQVYLKLLSIILMGEKNFYDRKLIK